MLSLKFSLLTFLPCIKCSFTSFICIKRTGKLKDLYELDRYYYHFLFEERIVRLISNLLISFLLNGHTKEMLNGLASFAFYVVTDSRLPVGLALIWNHFHGSAMCSLKIVSIFTAFIFNLLMYQNTAIMNWFISYHPLYRSSNYD